MNASLWQDEGLEARADALRKKHFGDMVELCAIINIRSGNCSMDCKFCAQSRHGRGNAPVWPLLPNHQLEKRIMDLAALPLAHIGLVASGAALGGQEFERLAEFIANAPQNIRARLCASIGRISKEQMRKLADCGLRRYHHNLETSESYYPHICTTQSWRQRRQTAVNALDCGLKLCSGALFGLGESWEDRIALARELKEIGGDCIPLNFYNPGQGKASPLSAQEALRIIALYRNIWPEVTLRVCGGRQTTLGAKQEEMFAAGANALMTGDFLTTRGSLAGEDMEMLKRLGLKLAV